MGQGRGLATAGRGSASGLKVREQKLLELSHGAGEARGVKEGQELKDSYRDWCSPDTGLGHIFSIPVRAVCRLPRTGCSWGGGGD